MPPRLASRLAALLLALLWCLGAGRSEAAERGRPGDFDFWVLSLSWSPSWCEATGNARRDVQCARPFAFVVHGLWPQYARGFPSDCAADTPPPDRRLVASLLDVMPSPGLVFHEWRTHGTCSGLSAPSYFKVVRKVFETIRIPAAYAGPQAPQMVAPGDVEQAFIAANRGLDADEIAVSCDGRRLQEVRICLKKDLSGFTRCGDVERRACRLDKIYMPAVRGGGR